MKIKNVSLAITLALLLFGCTSSETEIKKELNVTMNESYNGKILAIGDSLTEGYGIEKSDSYPSQLQVFLKKKGLNYQVINSGISGETTTGLANRIEWSLSHNPDVVILNSGANDAMRGVDLSITKNNLSTVIKSIQAKKIPILLGGMQVYENLGEKYVSEFKDLYPALAKEHNVPLIPFFLEGVAGNPKLNINDQIHPNKDGYAIIIEKNIWPVLKKIIK